MNPKSTRPPESTAFDALDPVIVEAGTATANEPATLVWLHGLGADGYDFVPFAKETGLAEQGVRFVFPQAPVRPVTINGGLAMRAWYDILSPAFGSNEDAAGIRASGDAVSRLLDAERGRGIAPQRLVLAGFSQGGAICLHAGLRLRWRLAGLIALSCYLPLADDADRDLQPGNVGLPLFRGHGTRDPIIPVELGRASNRRLAELGMQLDEREYPIEHGVSLPEIRDIRNWLVALLDLK